MEAIMTEEKNRETAPVQLETARMILRDHRQEDFESHHALLSDPEVMYYLPDIMTHSREESLKDLMISVEAVSAQRGRNISCAWRIRERGTHRGNRLYGFGGNACGQAGTRRIFQQKEVLGKRVYDGGIPGIASVCL